MLTKYIYIIIFFFLMKRKVIKQGPSTLMISLPAAWARKYGVEKGDNINIEEQERSLKVSTEKSVGFPPKEFDARDLDIEHIRLFLDEFYSQGYDELKIIYDTPSLVKGIQEYLSESTLGYEIVNQYKSSIVVKSISENIDEEFDRILRRCFLIIKQFSENILETLNEKNYASLKGLLIMEETNRKLTNFCERVLNKKGYKKFSKTNFVYCIVWQLESLGRSYRRICEYVSENNPELNEKTLELFADTNTLFNEFYELFYNFDKKRLMNFSEKCKKIKENAIELQINCRKHDDIVTNHLLVIIRKIHHMLQPLIGVFV